MISLNKLKHTISVARECRELAKKLRLPKDKQNAAFVMGLLHDIGYEDCGENISEHPEVGYNLIQDYLANADEINNAIRNHGRKLDNIGVMDFILNFSDLTIDNMGNHVTIYERLETLKNKYGEENSHYKHAVSQAHAIMYSTDTTVLKEINLKSDK